MASTLHGNPNIVFTGEEAPWVEIDPKTEIITGRAVFRCHKDSTTGAPEVGDVHPFDGRALLAKVRLTMQQGYLIVYTCDYIGLARSPRTRGELDFQGTTSEDPIELHPDFEDVIGGTAAAPRNDAKFDPETGEFLGFGPAAPLKYRGVRSYFSPRGVLRYTFYSFAAECDVRDLGRKFDPPNIISLPEVGSRDWLFTGAGHEEYVNLGSESIYRTTYEWFLSAEKATGLDGWEPTIYKSGAFSGSISGMTLGTYGLPDAIPDL